ncbi:MAG: SH3 domain-containing protein [Clostridia bacterium]|nr:SH3 domain-containing protein [Clostridia bacterium]
MKKARNLLALLCALGLLLSALPAGADNLSGIYDYAVVSGTANLNLRGGPSANDAWLGSAAEGSWVGLIAQSGNWYWVYVPALNQFGYMSKNFLKTSSQPTGGGSTTGVVSNPKATQFLNLRQYPSLDAPVVGIYYNGAAFTVLSYNDGWYQVQIDGNVGYFRQEYVRITGSSGGSSVAYVRTGNSGKLNLRSAPSYTGSSILAQYPNGTQVSILLKGKAAAGSTFYKVSIQGTTGYVDAAFLSSSSVTPYQPSVPSVSPATPVTKGTATVNNPKSTQYLNLRSQPSSSAKVIAQYKNGVRFQVIEPGETWCKVYGSASGNIGYMMTRYLKLSGVSAHPTKTVQNGSTFVNLRSAPNQNGSTVYQRVYSGAKVTVLIPGDQWTQVRYGNTTGYMMTQFLR